MAWMMWHAAADRRLPEIERVLEGVPPDMRHVIQKLIEKEPAKRYQSADEALADLINDPQAAAAGRAAEDEAAAEALRAKRRKRNVLIAVACSMALSVAMLFLPDGDSAPPPKEQFETQRGVVSHLVANQRTLVVDTGGPGQPPEFNIRRGDEVRLNDRIVSLRELKPGDRVTVLQEVRNGKRVLVVVAIRPQKSRGTIKRLQADEGHMTLAIEEGPDQGVSLKLSVPSTARVVLNGSSALLSQIAAGDHAEVTHAQDGHGRVVTMLVALRPVAVSGGVIREVDAAARIFKISVEGKQELLELPYRDDCEVTLNELRFLNDALLKPADLLPGDLVKSMVRDTHVLQLNAYRTFEFSGTVLAVRTDTRTVDVSTDEAGKFLTFRIGSDCPITLGGEPIELEDLHRRDRAQFTHDSPDRANLDALKVSATRPIEPGRWAVVVGIQDYDDQTLTRPPAALGDARSIRKTLVSRYAVSPDQAVLLENPSRIRLEQELPELFRKAADAPQLIVFFAGHAFVEDGKLYLAPKDFARSRTESSGLLFHWLIERLEECTAREKLLVLDGCHAASETQAAGQPSTQEMVELYKQSVPKPALKTVTVLASCSRRQRGVVLGADGGLFARSVAQALTGSGDANGDNRVNSSELFEFARNAMTSYISDDNQTQTPALFLPDDTPPRLTEEGKGAIRDQLTYLARSRVEEEEAVQLYEAADKLAPDEPEPRLALGLTLIKARKLTEAIAPLRGSQTRTSASTCWRTREPPGFRPSRATT